MSVYDAPMQHPPEHMLCSACPTPRKRLLKKTFLKNNFPLPCTGGGQGVGLLLNLHSPPSANRLVNRRHDLHVLHAFFARHDGRTLFENAAREVVELRGEHVDLRKRQRLAIAARAFDPAVVVSGIELEPATIAV